MAARIKKGDNVVVIAGREKGRSGTVASVRPKEGRVVLEGLNQVVRHRRATASSEGGRVQQSAPLAISNVALLDPQDKKPTRVRFGVNESGDKVRIAVRSGKVIDV